MKNIYEFQSEVFCRLIAGETEADLWNDYRLHQEYLKHFIGDGNPTTNDFRMGIKGLIQTTNNNIASAKRVGPLAEKELTLNMSAATLAGSILKTLSRLEPTTLSDANDILASYAGLAQRVDRDTLEDAVSHLDDAARDVYDLDVVRLYGDKE